MSLTAAILILNAPLALRAQPATAPTARSTAASAAGADNEPVALPEFTVSSERANAYRATDSLSAARIRGDLLDTPATAKCTLASHCAGMYTDVNGGDLCARP